MQQASQPLLAMQAGTQYTQLNNAITQQGVQNQLATSNLVQQGVQRQTQERMAQPSTTTTQQIGALDVLGALVGMGAAGAGAAFGGIQAFRK